MSRAASEHAIYQLVIWLTGILPPRALCTQTTENEFALANDPLAERARSWRRHVKPVHVFDIAAAVTDEVVMPHTFRIESRGPTLDGHFADQASLHQVPQIIVSCGPGRARVHTIDGFKNFRSRGMPVGFHQECHDSVTLRCTPQPTVFQGLFNSGSIHE